MASTHARIRRIAILGAAVLSLAGLATIAQAEPVSVGQQQATAAIKTLTKKAARAAAAPGGTVTTLPGVGVATSGEVLRPAAPDGCAAQAAALKAHKITSYRCTRATAKVVKASQSMNRAAVAWPSACSSGSGTLSGWVAVDRRNACNHIEIDIVTTLQPSGEVIGTTVLHAVSTMTASTSSARWANTTYLWLWSFTGVGAPSSATGLLFPSCSTSCFGSGGTWTRLSDGMSWRGTGNADITVAKGQVDRNVGGFWEYTMNGAGWGNPVTAESPVALSRCDDANPGTSVPGCVFSNIPALVGFSQSAVPAFVRHVYGAQLSGLPGRLSTGTYLTRLTDAGLTSKNGSKACPSTILRPSGKSCDEYPFRSTYQGAYTSGATRARSLPWCQMPDPQRTGSTGWSRCFIPSGQNSSAGGTLGAFYRSQRMLAHDRFQVGYLP